VPTIEPGVPTVDAAPVVPAQARRKGPADAAAEPAPEPAPDGSMVRRRPPVVDHGPGKLRRRPEASTPG